MGSPITTHVLDTAKGKPAAGIFVVLEFYDGENTWKELGEGTTNKDGRVTDLLSEKTKLTPGIYRLTFSTKAYRGDAPGFYPYVPIIFEIHDPEQHYHVPLLLNPFGYSTYRGS